MAKRMLIDATHAEEIRVVVVNGTRLEEFDVETSTKQQLKGNIYLAKIVRVEPSLQAAFVDYGGGRHGFLAFNEIHPDYYQIPVADRQAFIAAQRENMNESAAESADFDDVDDGAQADTEGSEDTSIDEKNDDQTSIAGIQEENLEEISNSQAADVVEGADRDIGERRPNRGFRHYKIQEVIKRRQIVLVQVVREERGNKGAALTTYLSLAGRYCVLMPNTARGGGVSRKITNIADRKRLKSVVNELEIPDGMAVIVRTAGSERTKPEIRRDYEYLLRLWDSIRDLTLRSIAPSLVYEEADLIKRSIRDLYSRDIEEVLVEGDDGYRLAKDFMRMLIPSHAKKVQLFKEPGAPLFHKFQVEDKLDAMHNPVVQLRSGGYLVINQTEALVAIDVNSGRATKERYIEETAFKTNCEAADEIARQLRLRDLAGLIVIDFIDMEETRNNNTVERRLKDAVRFDRARIQIGRISSFGLLELSRQRLRPSLMESSFQPCIHCNGTGIVRSIESASIHVLRAIEEEGGKRRSKGITITTHPNIALYILNHKRYDLAEIEARYSLIVYLEGDGSLVPPIFRMERIKPDVPLEALLHSVSPVVEERPVVHTEYDDIVDDILDDHENDLVEVVPEVKHRNHRRGRRDEPVVDKEHSEGDEENLAPRRRRRNRRRRRRSDEPQDIASLEQPDVPLDIPVVVASPPTPPVEEEIIVAAPPEKTRVKRIKKTEKPIEDGGVVTDEVAPPKPVRRRTKKVVEEKPDVTVEVAVPEAPPRKGWWNRFI